MRRLSSVLILLFYLTPSYSAQDMSMTLNEFSFCMDVTNLLKLVADKSPEGISKKINKNRTTKSVRADVPDTYQINLPMKKFETIGIARDKDIIYYQRERGSSSHWTDSVHDVLDKKCDATSGGVFRTTNGTDRFGRKIKFYVYVDENVSIRIAFPVQWVRENIFIITILDNSERKRIQASVTSLLKKKRPGNKINKLANKPETRVVKQEIKNRETQKPVTNDHMKTAEDKLCKFSDFGCDGPKTDIIELMEPAKKPQKPVKKKPEPEIVNHYCWRIEDMPPPAFREYHSWATPPKCLRSYYGPNPGSGAWHCNGSPPSTYNGQKLENCGAMY